MGVLSDACFRQQSLNAVLPWPMPGTREQILEERRQLKAEYGALFDSITALLFRHDPIGINFEDNVDEYEPETGTILPRLRYLRVLHRRASGSA